ncbi:MAG TPA: SRPBCC family protein [Thermoleophilaceae bacterium]|nr:SRPBCC family protein [Thermoleophilaceae bacterium]
MWDALEDAASWPEWWRGVERVRVLDDERYLIAWRSRIPYELEFEFRVERMDPPSEMTGTATGELTGSGHWRLFEQAGVTAVTYEWDVRTTRRWMNVLAPVARPAFEYNHNVVMRWGGEGLAERLGCRLLGAG